MQLSKEQEAAVHCLTHNAIVAIPGSGKTRVLTEKCKYLVGAGEQYILALSYTRASAIELLDRIEQELGQLPEHIIHVATFHKVLYDHLFAHGFAEHFVDNKKCISILHQVLSEEQADAFAIDTVITFIGHDDNTIKTMDTVLANKAKYTSPSKKKEAKAEYALFKQLQSIRHRFLEHLKKHDQYDLSSLIDYALSKFITGQLPLLSINHLLIDEFQDADPQQVAFALLHGNAGVTITVVGDDDQSIYKFRKAMGFNGFEMIRKKLNAQYLTLSTNYRSHAEILSQSFALVEQNIHRIDKSPVAAKGPGGKVRAYIASDQYEEAMYIVDHINIAPDKPTFIIGRTNTYLDYIESVLKEVGIEYMRSGNKDFYDQPLFHQVFSMLLNLSHCHYQAMIYDAHVLFPEMDASHFSHKGLMSSDRSSSDAFKAYQSAYRYFRTNDIDNGIREFILGIAPKLLNNPKQIDLLKSLQKRLSTLPGTVAQRLMLLTKDAQTQAKGKVVLMTMHGSKGLESERVFVVGMNDGAIPSKKSLEEYGYEGVEEERRLLFVAMTRAEKELHLLGQQTGVGVKPARVPSEWLIYYMEKLGA